jgi:hypothetical protein
LREGRVAGEEKCEQDGGACQHRFHDAAPLANAAIAGRKNRQKSSASKKSPAPDASIAKPVVLRQAITRASKGSPALKHVPIIQRRINDVHEHAACSHLPLEGEGHRICGGRPRRDEFSPSSPAKAGDPVLRSPRAMARPGPAPAPGLLGRPVKPGDDNGKAMQHMR